MTKTNMDLSELLAKQDGGDFLRAVAEAVLQLIMEADVEGLIRAGKHEREERVSKVNITPIVVTLATNAILMGAVRAVSGGSPMTAPQELAEFSHSTFLGIPMTLVLAMLFIIIISLLTKRTVPAKLKCPTSAK